MRPALVIAATLAASAAHAEVDCEHAAQRVVLAYWDVVKGTSDEAKYMARIEKHGNTTAFALGLAKILKPDECVMLVSASEAQLRAWASASLQPKRPVK